MSTAEQTIARSSRHAAVVRLRRQGLYHRQIAEILGITRHSVAAHIRTAVKLGELPPQEPHPTAALKPLPLLDAADDSWRHRAVCRDAPDPDCWYPLSSSDMAENPAKLVCARCPVKRSCLEEALRRGDDFGVWGGTGPGDRRRIRAGQLTVDEALVYRHPRQMAGTDA